MENFKETSGEKEPSAKSIHELMNLLMKLNAKLREKIPSSRKKNTGPGKTDMVIIIMTSQEESSRSPKSPRGSKPEPPKDEWIQGLCREIERGAYSEKKP